MGTLADIPYPESLTRFCEIRAYQILADFNSPMTTQEVEQVAIVASELGELGTCKPRSILNGLSLAYRKVPRLRRRVARPKETGLKRSVYSYWISDVPRTEDDNSLRAPEQHREQHGRKSGYKQGHPGPVQPPLPLEAPAVPAPWAADPMFPTAAPVLPAPTLEQRLRDLIDEADAILREHDTVSFTFDSEWRKLSAAIHVEIK